jgi:hypothetical protein
MNEIICPHCGKAFKIDEAGYADILKQIRDREFDKALHERLELAEKEKETAIELAETKVTSKLEKAAAKKEAEIERLKAELVLTGVATQLAVKKAVSAVEKERDGFARNLEAKATEQKLSESVLKEAHTAELKSKDDQIAFYKDLKAKLPTKMVSRGPTSRRTLISGAVAKVTTFSATRTNPAPNSFPSCSR